MEAIDFYYIERPQGCNEFMLFARYSNMPPTCFHGTLSLMTKIKRVRNKWLNVEWVKASKPKLHLKEGVKNI